MNPPVPMDIQRTDRSDERIPCSKAYPLLGFATQQQFNHVRRRLERARNRDTGVLVEVPEFRALEARLGAAECRRRETEFFRNHILVVPEWGGIKWPSGSWTYSRNACEAIRDHGVQALELAG